MKQTHLILTVITALLSSGCVTDITLYRVYSFLPAKQYGDEYVPRSWITTEMGREQFKDIYGGKENSGKIGFNNSEIDRVKQGLLDGDRIFRFVSPEKELKGRQELWVEGVVVERKGKLVDGFVTAFP